MWHCLSRLDALSTWRLTGCELRRWSLTPPPLPLAPPPRRVWSSLLAAHVWRRRPASWHLLTSRTPEPVSSLASQFPGVLLRLDRDAASVQLLLTYLRSGVLPTRESECRALAVEADFFALPRLVDLLSPYQPAGMSTSNMANLAQENALRAGFIDVTPAGRAAAATAADSLLVDVFAQTQIVAEAFPGPHDSGLRLLFSAQRQTRGAPPGEPATRAGLAGFKEGWAAVTDGHRVVGAKPYRAIRFPDLAKIPGVVAAGGAMVFRPSLSLFRPPSFHVFSHRCSCLLPN